MTWMYGNRAPGTTYSTSTMVTIDPRAVDHLGPANAEQRAETRESWRTWFRRILHIAHVLAVITAVVVAGAVLIGVGLVLGAFNPDLVLEVLR